MKFFETSAKDGTNVRESFYTIARDVLHKMLDTSPSGDASSGGAVAAAKGKGGKDKDCTVA
jgi:GTPase SAR1 family protein